MSTTTQANQDLPSESYARHIGDAILFIDTNDAWKVGQKGQKISEYVSLKFNGLSSITDKTFKFTAQTAEMKTGGGYTIILQSELDPNLFLEVYADTKGNITGGKPLTPTELLAAEDRLGVDLNNNGGLGDGMVLIDAGTQSAAVGATAKTANLLVNAFGAYQIQSIGNTTFTPITFAGTPVTQNVLKGFQIESVTSITSGYQLFIRDANNGVISVATDKNGAVDPASIRPLDQAALNEAEAQTGHDLNGKGDTPAASGWTTALKTSVIRTEVEKLIVNGAKIDHAGLVKIVDAAIQSLNASGGSTVGDSVFNDFVAISNRAASLFTSKDLAGNESGYLQYVFDKMVNGDKANNFYTGGNTKSTELGNLSPTSTVDILQKLENKWLLGKDLPNPQTEGDTANPNAAAASGVYKVFDAPLMVGGAAAFDVNQGSAGTCYLLASMATVAQVSATTYNAVFVSNGVGANGLPTWGVRLFGTNGKVSWVTVDNELAVRDTSSTTALYTKVKGVDATGASVQELWAPLIEKAYAQANEQQVFARDKGVNSMFAIEGGNASGIPSLTGSKVIAYDTEAGTMNAVMEIKAIPEGSTALAEYTKAINSGKPCYVGSSLVTKNADGVSLFVSGHAYMAYDADPNSSTNTTVKIYNPWGYSTADTHIAPFDADLATLVGNPSLTFWVGV